MRQNAVTDLAAVCQNSETRLVLSSKLLRFDKRRQISYYNLMNRGPNRLLQFPQPYLNKVRSHTQFFFNPVTKGLSTLSTLHSTNNLT